MVACLVSNLSTLTYIYLPITAFMYCNPKSLFLLFFVSFLLLYLTSAPAGEKYKFQGSNFTSVGDSWFSFFPFSLSIFCAVFCFLYFFSFFSCFQGQKFACMVQWKEHTQSISQFLKLISHHHFMLKHYKNVQ